MSTHQPLLRSLLAGSVGHLMTSESALLAEAHPASDRRGWHTDLRSDRRPEGRLRRIAPSIAHRIPRPKQRGSRTGSIVDPFRWRTVWFESALEEDVLHVLVASPNVSEVREQQVIRYGGPGVGTPTYHCDFRVRWSSGTTSTVEVKYEEDVVGKAVATKIAGIGRNALVGGTDDYRTATELDIDEVTIANARAIVACALDDDPEALDAVRRALPRMPDGFDLGELADASGLGFRGYRAATALLQSDALSLAPDVRISPEAPARVGRPPLA